MIFHMIDLEQINFEELVSHDFHTAIRERYLDVFGHVNNAQYMVLFEEARWDMITSRGYGLADILEKKIGTVVLESTIRYRREIKNREKIVIRTRMVGTKKILLKLKQEILKENGELAADATFLLGCFDLNSRKLVQPTEDWLHAVLGFKKI